MPTIHKPSIHKRPGRPRKPPGLKRIPLNITLHPRTVFAIDKLRDINTRSAFIEAAVIEFITSNVGVTDES